jgi:hypothetical protein
MHVPRMKTYIVRPFTSTEDRFTVPQSSIQHELGSLLLDGPPFAHTILRSGRWRYSPFAVLETDERIRNV